MAYWLAFDIGTTGTKAALLDSDGRAIRSAYRDYPTYSGDGGVMEQDARQWWVAACEAAREVEAGAIEGIVLTGQMQDVILIDTQGEPTYPVILYSDSRAVRETGAIQAAIGADHLIALTGNAQEAGSLLAKLVWLQSNQPHALERASHLLTDAADYIAFKLTGVAATDTTTASTTGLMELESRAWLQPDTFKAAGIQAISRLLPRLVAGGTRIGSAHETGAAAFGVPALLESRREPLSTWALGMRAQRRSAQAEVLPAPPMRILAPADGWPLPATNAATPPAEPLIWRIPYRGRSFASRRCSRQAATWTGSSG